MARGIPDDRENRPNRLEGGPVVMGREAILQWNSGWGADVEGIVTRLWLNMTPQPRASV